MQIMIHLTNRYQKKNKMVEKGVTTETLRQPVNRKQWT